MSEMDEVVLQYIAMMETLLDFQELHLVHVINHHHLPHSIKEVFPSLTDDHEKEVEEQIERMVKVHFNELGCIPVIQVHHGNGVDKILDWAANHDMDLIVFGKKTSMKGSGVLPGRVVKVSHCSVLFVTENPPSTISKVVIPIDFSSFSVMAIDACRKIAKNAKAEILFQHSYSVPTGYHTTGKSYEEFAAIMEKHARKDFKRFRKEVIPDEEADCEFILDSNHHEAENAYKFASDSGADLIIIGSRGRTKLASFLMGSIAEKMTKYDHDIPLLVVKNKEKNMNFLKALLQI